MFQETWKNEEIQYIKENLENKDYLQLASDLGRTKLSVERKMTRLGITPGKRWIHKNWPNEKVQYLIDNASKKTYQEMAKHFEITPHALAKKMRKLGLIPKKHSKFKTVNHSFFKTWSEEMSYILGFWWADGCIKSKNNKSEFDSHYIFNIGQKEREILDKINSVMKSTYQIVRHEGQKNGKNFVAHSLSISSKEIYDDIISLGGTERKSLTAKFPESIPQEYVRHFIRGFFDGDGCVRSNRLHITFVGTYDFLSKLSSYLPHCIETKKINGKKISGMDTSGWRAVDVLEYMYKDSIIYLDRKYNLYKKWCS